MRRIQRAQDKERLVQELTVGDSPCFREIWRLMIFAATLGFKLGRRERLSETDSGKAIPESYFANSTAWPGLLFMLGLVETNETNLLHSSNETENELVTVFEEYANGGLSFLMDRFANKGVNLLSLLDVTFEIATASPDKPNLSNIAI